MDVTCSVSRQYERTCTVCMRTYTVCLRTCIVYCARVLYVCKHSNLHKDSHRNFKIGHVLVAAVLRQNALVPSKE